MQQTSTEYVVGLGTIGIITKIIYGLTSVQESRIVHALLAEQCTCRRCNFAIPVIDYNDAILRIDVLQNLIAEGVDCPRQKPCWV